jgi:hypothetical protein
VSEGNAVLRGDAWVGAQEEIPSEGVDVIHVDAFWVLEWRVLGSYWSAHRGRVRSRIGSGSAAVT